MNLNKQIKKYRTREQLSQEELAEKLYVSRQTISNWENEKSYPDIHNLLLMSVLFNVSLDDLVKGDVEIMKNEVKNAQLNNWAIAMGVSAFFGAISIGPIMTYLGAKGLLLSLALFGYSWYSANKIEKIKKNHHLKSFKEILAFLEGRNLSEEEKIKSKKNDKYLTVLIVILSAVISGALAWLSLSIFD